MITTRFFVRSFLLLPLCASIQAAPICQPGSGTDIIAAEQSAGGDIIYRVDTTNGSTTVLFTTTQTANGMNGLASNPDDRVIYWGSGQILYYYDPETNTEGVFADLTGQLNGTLESGGGAYHDGFYYFGVESGDANGLYRIPIDSSGGGTAPSGPVQLLAANQPEDGLEAAFGPEIDPDYGDMIVTTNAGGDVVIFGATRDIANAGFFDYWSYNVTTGAFNYITDVGSGLQIAMDDTGQGWAVRDNGEFRSLNVTTGALGPVISTFAFSAADLGGTYCDPPELDSYAGDNAGNSGFNTLDQVYYRDPAGTGNPETAFYTGGDNFSPNTSYDVAYYDAEGNLVFSDTDAAADASGFLTSMYAPADGLDGADPNFAYGTWTAVVVADGVTPQATLTAQLADDSTIITDPFDVLSWSETTFTDSSGNPVTEYDVSAGTGTAYVQVDDQDENTDPTAIESITVTITDPTTGDSMTVTLFETGPDTGVFANDAGGNRLEIPLEVCAVNDPLDGRLCVPGTAANLNADYTDPTDSADSSADVVTTPVTLASFRAVVGPNDGDLSFRWSTATETQNLGFNLYVRQDGEWRRINAHPIPSPVGNSVSVQRYRYDGIGVYGRVFALEDIDARGNKTFHGPFRLGKQYGSQRLQRQATDWEHIHAEHKAKRKARKARKRKRMHERARRARRMH